MLWWQVFGDEQDIEQFVIAADEDKDGMISKAEWIGFLMSQMPEDIADKTFDDSLARFDVRSKVKSNAESSRLSIQKNVAV